MPFEVLAPSDTVDERAEDSILADQKEAKTTKTKTKTSPQANDKTKSTSNPTPEKIDSAALIEAFEGVIFSQLDEPMVLAPDADILSPGLLKAVATAAELIGHNNYDASVTGTYEYLIFGKDNDKKDYLSGPSVVSDGIDCCIQWGDELVKIPSEQSLIDRKPFLFIPGDKDTYPSLILQPKGIKFPINLGLTTDTKEHKQRPSLMMECETFGDLRQYLRIAGKAKSVAKVENDTEFVITNLLMSKPRKDKPEEKWASLSTNLEGFEQIYAPDPVEFWETCMYPVQATKTDGLVSVVTADDKKQDFTLGMNLNKLGTLDLGTYKVVGYESFENKFKLNELKYLIKIEITNELGEVIVEKFATSSTKGLLDKRLHSNPVITLESPAELEIYSKTDKETNTGIKYTECGVKFILASDKENPQVLALKALAARKKAAASEPVAV